MGATRWQTIRQVVLPNAISGILTGIILEVSRTAGETAPIMFTGAVFFSPFLPQGVFDQTMALSLHLFVVATQVPGVPEDLPYGVALVLIALVLIMNSLSIALWMSTSAECARPWAHVDMTVSCRLYEERAIASPAESLRIKVKRVAGSATPALEVAVELLHE